MSNVRVSFLTAYAAQDGNSSNSADLAAFVADCERRDLGPNKRNPCLIARDLAKGLNADLPAQEICNASGSVCGTPMVDRIMVAQPTTPEPVDRIMVAKPTTPEPVKPSEAVPPAPSGNGRATGNADDGGVRAARSAVEQGAIDSRQKAAQADDAAGNYRDAAAITRSWQSDASKRTAVLNGQINDLRANGKFSSEEERKFLAEKLNPEKFREFYADAGIITKQDLMDQSDKLQERLKQGADKFEKNSEFWKNEARQANGAAEKMRQFKRALTDSELKLKSMGKTGSDKNGSELSASANEGKSLGKKASGPADAGESSKGSKNHSVDSVLQKFNGELGNGPDGKPKNNKMMEAALSALEAEEKRQKLVEGRLDVALATTLNPTEERNGLIYVKEVHGANLSQDARLPAGVHASPITTIFQIVTKRIRLCESRGDINGKSALEKIP